MRLEAEYYYMRLEAGCYYRDYWGDLVRIIDVNEDLQIMQIESVKRGVVYWIKLSSSWLLPISSLEKALF